MQAPDASVSASTPALQTRDGGRGLVAGRSSGWTGRAGPFRPQPRARRGPGTASAPGLATSVAEVRKHRTQKEPGQQRKVVTRGCPSPAYPLHALAHAWAHLGTLKRVPRRKRKTQGAKRTRQAPELNLKPRSDAATLASDVMEGTPREHNLMPAPAAARVPVHPCLPCVPPLDTCRGDRGLVAKLGVQLQKDWPADTQRSAAGARTSEAVRQRGMQCSVAHKDHQCPPSEGSEPCAHCVRGDTAAIMLHTIKLAWPLKFLRAAKVYYTG